jgi:hypothetical protein
MIRPRIDLNMASGVERKRESVEPSNFAGAFWGVNLPHHAYSVAEGISCIAAWARGSLVAAKDRERRESHTPRPPRVKGAVPTP